MTPPLAPSPDGARTPRAVYPVPPAATATVATASATAATDQAPAPLLELAAVPGAGPGAEAPPPERRALVVEDDAAFRRLMEEILQQDGYAVTVTPSAFAAVELARRVRPHVIILDLGLPLRSGAALLADLKADPLTGSVPVVVVSALPDVLTPREQGMATAVVRKPFHLPAFLELLRVVLALDARDPGPSS